MKAIIEGKKYDTETATELARESHSNGGDFSHYDEGLYRTRNGNWFLAGSGGPMSRYSRSIGQNSWSGGSAIIPLSKAEAREWLEENECVAQLEEYFSEDLVEA